ncbi:class I SAM-dependent methyltransferase [Desulforamulus profundi]|uniref:class I SAM-dependent methyltransferase n=1 Tax=Desulforamulus profundi TaxID=1383067 RepID=UPI001177B3D0|nr:class I SAM-dependent methyltransferase [Desulforamulus profundi]
MSNPLMDKIQAMAKAADDGWGKAYGLFGKVVQEKELKVGAEIGVAFGGHAESLLKIPTLEKLYGVDPYLHMENYNDPMNLPQLEFDQLYQYTLDRLSSFAEKYRHIRKPSIDAVNDIVGQIDFVYIDADHSFQGVLRDLTVWFPKVTKGGIIGGHDYGHPNFPGVKRAVDEFLTDSGGLFTQREKGFGGLKR